MMIRQQAKSILFLAIMLLSAVAVSTRVESQLSPDERDVPSVFDGVLSNVAGASEISTVQLRAALADSSAIILDARPYEEYAVSHIPGARAVPAKAGTTPALRAVAEAIVHDAFHNVTFFDGPIPICRSCCTTRKASGETFSSVDRACG
jgi:3-mercaptopyruvate sulfurtransferase SseA